MIRPALFLCLLLPISAQAQDDSAIQFGETFCQASIDGDMAPVERLLSPELAAILDAAEKRNAGIAAAHPDEKPPLGDGIPWRSWPDYADDCAVIGIRNSATSSGIVIRYGFSSEPDAGYEDTLVVIPAADQAGHLRLDDIIFEDEQTLRAVLEDVAAAEN